MFTWCEAKLVNVNEISDQHKVDNWLSWKFRKLYKKKNIAFKPNLNKQKVMFWKIVLRPYGNERENRKNHIEIPTFSNRCSYSSFEIVWVFWKNWTEIPLILKTLKFLRKSLQSISSHCAHRILHWQYFKMCLEYKMCLDAHAIVDIALACISIKICNKIISPLKFAIFSWNVIPNYDFCEDFRNFHFGRTRLILLIFELNRMIIKNVWKLKAVRRSHSRDIMAN